MLAARSGHLEIAQSLDRAGSAIGLADHAGNTGLYHAIDDPYEDVIAYLGTLGAIPIQAQFGQAAETSGHHPARD